MKIRISIVCLMTILFFAGCTIRPARIKKMSVEQKMAMGNEYFDRGRYNRAIPFFLEVTLERRSIYTAEAQMKLAESYFRQGKYLDAIFEYQEMIKLFPDYRDIEDAYFNIGLSYKYLSLGPHYCQNETLASIDAFNIFLDRFRQSPRRTEAIQYITELRYKLLQKKYYNGYIYYRIFDYSSALVYFDEIIALGNRDTLEEKSLYYSGLIYLERKDYDSLLDVKEMMLQYYPESSNTRRIRRSYQRVFR